MANWQWTKGAQEGGCEGVENRIDPGWYLGQPTAKAVPVVTTYKNPATGKPYTIAELNYIIGTMPETPPNVTYNPNKPTSSSTWIVVGIGLVVVLGIVAFIMLK